jgi:Holliday junction resolvase
MEKRERDIESGLRRQVEKMGGKFMKFTSPGNDGVPDRIAVLPGGRVWFVELKREGEKPTGIQKWQMEQLRKMGCNVALITGKQEAVDWCVARGLDREQLEYENSLEPYIDPQTIAEEVRDEILREYEAGGGS